ncbi:MAG: hypothetical protein K2O40_08375 [Lachnospiraceae bacterium]|nr:hypothetical protein [Lachnospiraceae bacterium]
MPSFVCIWAFHARMSAEFDGRTGGDFLLDNTSPMQRMYAAEAVCVQCEQNPMQKPRKEFMKW